MKLTSSNAPTRIKKPILFSPNTGEPVICVYGEGSTGKTSEIFKLIDLGYNLTYLDLNHKPQFEILPADLWGRVNYLRVKNYPGVDNISMTVSALSTAGAVDLCAEHGAKACPICPKSEQFNLKIKDLENTIFVMDEATTYVNIQIENSLNEATSGQAMEEYSILSGKMSKFYNFLKKFPVPVILIAHEVEVGAEPLRKANMGGPKKGIIYPLLGSSVKSQKVGAPQFSHVLRTLKVAESKIGTKDAVQYSRTSKAFANSGSHLSAIKDLPLSEALAYILGERGKHVELDQEEPSDQ